MLVPTSPDDPAVPANLAAWEVWEGWTKPVLTLWAPGDIVLGHLQQGFIDRIPGAAAQPLRPSNRGVDFIQDDCGEDVAAAIIRWLT